MNINDVNNPLISGEIAKGRQISEKKEAGRTGKTSGRVKARKGSEPQPSQDTGAARQSRDVYESAETRSLAAEMASAIDDKEPESRTDAVNRASERARSDYYNSDEFMERLAVKMVNTRATRL